MRSWLVRTVSACILSATAFGVLGFVVRPTPQIAAQEKPADAPKYFKGRVAPKNLDHLRKVKFAQYGHKLKRMKQTVTPPATWDSRTKGWVPPVQDQQQCGSCFPPSVRILMGNGSQRRIDEILVGDQVVSAEGNLCFVTDTMSRAVQEALIQIEIAGLPLFQATDEHPVLILNDRGEEEYVKAGDLEQGQLVKVYAKQQSWRPIKNVQYTSAYTGDVYNLEVSNDHSYVANNIGVHNCWDFSGTGVVDVAYMVAGMGGTGKTWLFSEQYTLSCGKNGGCNGDDNTTVLEWAKSTGLPTQSDYGAYTASSGRCTWKSSMSLYKITDWTFAASSGDQQGVTPAADIKVAVMLHGGVGCAVAADDSFSNYSGGVFDRTTSQSIDHDVMIVGWDDTKSKVAGKTVWLVRNSWSPTWGESGYIWMQEGVNLIGTESVVAWVDNPSPTPVPLPPFLIQDPKHALIPGNGWSGSLIFDNGLLTSVTPKDLQSTSAIKP